MRLHYVTECSSHWSFRLIESTAGWDLPQYFFPSDSKKGGFGADGPKVLFLHEGKPKWIGTFAFSFPTEIYILQFSEEEVVVPFLDYVGSVLNIVLSDPDSSYELETYIFGTEPRIQIVGGRIILVNTSGFAELSSDGIKMLFYQYENGMFGKLLLYDTIIKNLRMLRNDVYIFDMVEYDQTRVEVCYDVVTNSIMYQRMIPKQVD